jgi:hypothetical protein
MVLGNCGVDDLAAVRLQGGMRPDPIGAHQARVARDISRQYRCQSTFDALLCHGGHPKSDQRSAAASLHFHHQAA